LPLPEIEPRSSARADRSLDTILTELFQLICMRNSVFLSLELVMRSAHVS
jgi:hypothetical protein